MMNAKALEYFLAYQGDYGDGWDCIFIPVLRAIAAGLKVIGVPVDYIHPPEQTQEEGTLMTVVKRVEQLQNLVPAIVAEAKKLGIIPC